MASFDEVKLEDILHGSFATFNPNTGANKDADSLPTIEVYEEGSGTALTITSSVTNITTGRYRWQATIAAADGFEAGKFYEVWITATTTGTDTITQSAPVTSFKATSRVVDDIATPAQVNTEVLDVLSVDTFAELASPPAATSSLKDKLTWLFMWAKNRATQTTTERKLYADDSTTTVSTEAVSDDGTTYDKSKAS